MRILVVLSRCPYPPRAGGTILAYHHLKELSRRNEVHVVCSGGPEPIGELAGAVRRFEFVPAPKRSRLGAKALWALRIIRGAPPLVAEFASTPMRRRVEAMLGEGGWDVVLVYDLPAVQYCPESALPIAVCDVEDPQSIRLDRLRRLPVWSAWERAKLGVIARLTERYERRVLSAAGRVLVTSAADAEDLRTLGGFRNAAWVTYAVTKPDRAVIPSYAERSPGMIVVSGNMFHPPNVDGVVWFLGEVFSHVLDRFPTGTLSIVGADPHPRIRSAAARFGDRVLVTGRVDDVSAYVRRAVVSVCPVRLEAGIQTKVLEAWSVGTPVVTTVAGNRGIGSKQGEGLWVANDPLELADRIAALLRGEDWDRLSRSGLALVDDRFSWKRSSEQLAAHLEAVRRGAAH
jgi:glycosyltransferase involved in cell wall biosynthesis